MADIKISQLGAASSVNDSDVLPMVASGVTVKASAAQLKEYAIGDTSISGIGDGTASGAISALNENKTPKSDIAMVESTVATQAHAIGDEFYLSGTRYKATAAIGQGDQIIEGTNCTAADPVCSDIASLNEALTNEVATRTTNGAHNLAVCKIDSGVENGLTWIAQDDGSAIATASSMSGNANITTTTFSLKAGSYILSKNPHIGNSRIGLLVNNSIYDNVLTYDDEIAFTLANDSSNCKIRVYCTAPTGGVVASTKIQPMIRLATDKDTTYQQGAMTNRELTEKANRIEKQNLTDVPSSVTTAKAFFSAVITEAESLLSNKDVGDYILGKVLWVGKSVYVVKASKLDNSGTYYACVENGYYGVMYMGYKNGSTIKAYQISGNEIQ